MKATLFGLLRRTRMPILAVVAALVLVATPVAFAANGKPFILGKKNTATKVSTLVKKGSGPALRLAVGSGAPLAVNSAVKVANLNADRLDGLDSTAFLGVGAKAADADRLDGQDSSQFVPTSTNSFVRNNIYKREGPVVAGNDLGDGTFTASMACFSGDVLLSGGPANVAPTSDMVESFPSPPLTGNFNSWSARIHKNGGADNWNVVVLCANQ